jgi:hypothetical protein
MNEKIRKFAEEAGLRFTMLTSNPMIPFVDGRQQDLEKFAELIVKEMLNISDEVITLSDSPEWLICERLGINHDWRRQDNFWS